MVWVISLWAAMGLLFAVGACPAHAESVGLKIRFGLTDEGPKSWSGRVRVSPGRVVGVEGWRFEPGDEVIGEDSWKAATRRVRKARRTNRPERARPVEEPPLDNGVVVMLDDVTEESTLRVETERGAFDLSLASLPWGARLTRLDGALEIERTAAVWPLTSGVDEDDFPAAAIDGEGRTHVAWVRFSSPRLGAPRIIEFRTPPSDFAFSSELPRGDQILLTTLTDRGHTEIVPITEPGRDIYKCAVAVDGAQRVWVFWAERRDGQFDVWGRPVEGTVPGRPIRISRGAGNDHSPTAVTDARGRIWVAWQGVRDGRFQILLRHQREDGSWSGEALVSPHQASSWAPAITATRPGTPGEPRVAVVWDTYEKGDYDVWIREYDLAGRAGAPVAAANSREYQARPSTTYDGAGNLWVAWEFSGATWGKDVGALVRKKGVGLFRDRRIGLIVRSREGAWLEPLQAVESVMPETRFRSIPRRDSGGMRLSEAARAALPYLGKPYHNLSRLALDRSGRVWMLFRSRAIDFRPTVGSMWLEYAAFYENGSWTGPILLPQSDNLLYSVPAVTAPPGGGLLAVYPSDHRQELRAGAVPYEGGFDVVQALSDPWTNDLFVARLSTPGDAAAPTFKPAAAPPAAGIGPSEATREERAHTLRGRAARAPIGGKPMRLLRGEFHRHTELSSDGGADGPLEDMWRYAIDVAALDWVGNGDHDNGHGREYPWWLIQKTTDAYQVDERFVSLFSYERSRPYPEGHRNVVFPKRGIRPLPRLPLAKESDPGPAPDTTMLYAYLAEHGGISVPHTSATNQGTDWRNPPHELEPLVEIYQGSRHSYEMPGAPRTDKKKRGGFERPAGFVSNALAKGHRLGFVSSSDHHSTHISYAMVWAEDATREAVFEALRQRRAYAATDDIVADVRMGEGDREAFMGQEIVTPVPPDLRIHLEGTAPFSRVVIIKDGREVQAFEPGQVVVRQKWVDPEPKPGETSVYYVRGEQADGELVWTSPIWATYEGSS